MKKASLPVGLIMSLAGVGVVLFVKNSLSRSRIISFLDRQIRNDVAIVMASTFISIGFCFNLDIPYR